MATEIPSNPKPVVGHSFKIALVQLGNITADKSSNLSRARSKILEAAKGGPSGSKTDIIVLPECFNSPYGVDYFDKYAEVIDFQRGNPYAISSSKSETVRMLSEVAKETGVWLFGGSIPEREAKTSNLYNTAIVFSPRGELVEIHRKLHLFDIDIPGGITFKESETLTGGDKVTLVDTDFGRIGLGICYDMRFPEMAMIAARRGAIAMIYPGAFNTTTGPQYWELLQRGRAVDNHVYVATCSPARQSEGYPAYGHSMLVDPTGKVVSETDEKESIVYGEVDIELINRTRRNIPITVQRRFDAYPDVSTS